MFINKNLYSKQQNMKIFYISILLFLLPQIIFSQQVENSDFEDWNNNSLLVWNNYVNAQGFSLRTANKTTDAFSGNYAVDMKTFTIGSYVVPGTIQLGYLNNKLLPSGGIAFNFRPNAISISLKYKPVNNDSLIIFAYLTKFNTQSNKNDTIGACFYAYNKAITEYKTLLIPIYYKTNDIPDSLNIFFSSSFIQRSPGSELIVDNLKLLYGNFFLPPQVTIPAQISDSGFTASWIGADYTKKYFLDVATDANFTNFLPNYHNRDVGDTSKFYVKVNNRKIKQIFYRVKADYDSVVSDYSLPINFFMPYEPVAYEPSSVSSKGFIAKWQKLNFADYYIFDLATDSSFSSFVPNYYYLTTNDTACHIWGLKPNKNYFYRVRARYFATGKSKFSNIIKIHTPPQYKNGEISVSYNKQNATIFIDTLSFANSNLTLLTTTGKIIWSGKLTDRFIYIPELPPQVILAIIQQKNGKIITKKLSFVDY
jgi:hypothetical protein